MFRQIAAVVLAALAWPALAQMTPVGVWRTVDDKTGEVSSEVRISDNAGVLSGRIEKLLRKDARQDDVCDKCTDERKNKPVLGLEIIRGAKRSDGKEVWEGGKILDPDNGKDYTLRLTPIEDGKQLQVRGYIAFFYRTQTWTRVP
ncbi:conserved hypothetical protein [Rhodoferax ferrireducens T118]|uniref:DUF2147 domain-containing protein n=1 Tax=Albidiferax ferrireducens (strain ATCC BAA-621 / DSM 15236 / T118) TaxID=338969 RepID=Q21SN0_ALBFT|nr:DUF2147 domain-containing protein [Rhodoferax ferrireducens]ABD71223.1 conserved hypothetical protein [Rhodoferax ferrireducens T118]